MKKKLKGRVNLASKEGQKLKGSSQFGVSAYYKENLNLKNGQILTFLHTSVSSNTGNHSDTATRNSRAILVGYFSTDGNIRHDSLEVVKYRYACKIYMKSVEGGGKQQSFSVILLYYLIH